MDESSSTPMESYEEKNSNAFPPFHSLHPKMIEFTALVPEYPKTHIEGHATVIDLDEKLAMKIASDKTFGSAMLKTIQYSRNNINGHGFRPVRHVQFFAVNRALQRVTSNCCQIPMRTTPLAKSQCFIPFALAQASRPANSLG